MSVDRTGALTRVALLESVDLGDVAVARATPHNMDKVRCKAAKVDDIVRVERADNVIPEVVDHVQITGQERDHVSEMPEIYPACGAKVDGVVRLLLPRRYRLSRAGCDGY